MHTISKDGDGTWCVGRMEIIDGNSSFMTLFKGMSFVSALRLCNLLNGGSGILPFSNDTSDILRLKAWETCAC